jgi:nitrogen fixation NifU-like protein
MSLYRDRIVEHYKNPHNEGTVDDPDVDVTVSNASWGDTLSVTARIEDGVIADIKFEGNGCALSVASASFFTDKLQGMAVDELDTITNDDVFDLAGLEQDEVSPMRTKCVLLSKDIIPHLQDDE